MSRSNTKDTITFYLPSPNAVTFTFPTASPPNPPPSNIRITVPASSAWHLPFHWHPYEGESAICKQVTCLSGSLRVYVARDQAGGNTLGYEGLKVKIEPGQRMAFY